MVHIAEPKGIDFVIQSKEFTDEEREEITEFISKRKKQLKESSKNVRKTKKPFAKN